MQRTTLIAGALVLTLHTAAAPQDSAPEPAAPARPMLQINPLGFLQFGPNIEVEFPVGTMMSVTPGVRIVSLGLASHLIADALSGTDLGFTWMVGGTFRVYPQQRPLGGFYVGPRVEVGRGTSSGDTDTFDSTYLAGASDFGYRWLYPSGLGLSMGLQAGAAHESWTGSDGTDGTTLFVFGMLVLGLGFSL